MSFALAFEGFPPGSRDLLYASVPWDSEIFGFPVYQLAFNGADPAPLSLALDRLLARIAGDRAVLACAKIPSDRVAVAQLLAARGFYPVETSVELSLPLARLQLLVRGRTDPLRLRRAVPNDQADLVALARQAFSADRFHLDPNLPPGKADERYAFWIEHAFCRKDPVWVYEHLSPLSLVGFAHLRPAGRGIDLALIAVTPAHHGTVIGPMMYQSILAQCRSEGYGFATARISMNNISIVNLLARLGFAFRRATTAFHWYHAAPEGE
jgi:GNAT superfamily N-acetyltransferase